MMTRDAAAAEEVAQDAFVRAFVHLHTYDERRPLYPWLSTIAVRLAQNHLAKTRPRRRREAPDPDAALETASALEPDPLADLISHEADRRVWQAVARLPYGERTAVLLYYRQDMKVRDIARALGVSDGTVKTLLFRARQKLRLRLDDASRETRS
jgi:RNA polymerase sigma-70 factor (ECF subfamily)